MHRRRVHVATRETRCDDAGAPQGAALRFDAGTLGKLERTPTGGVKVPARATRTGVLPYLRADGTTVLEWRSPEEVSRADSLASLDDAAVTIGHPASGKVTPATIKADGVGYVRGGGRMDGKFVEALLVVSEESAIKRMDSRELVELSCGYSCDVEMRSGVTPEGERYDAVQKNIRYNHVALLPRGGGRAGRDVALRLDGSGVEIDAQEKNDDTRTPSDARTRGNAVKERIDGIDYEVGTPAWEQASKIHDARVEAELVAARADAKDKGEKLTAATAQLAAEKNRADALEAELAPARLDQRVAERASLIEKVRPVLGAEAKFDGLSDHEIKIQTITKLDSSFRLDSVAESERALYVRVRFDSEMRHAAKPDAKTSPLADARMKVSTKTDSAQPPVGLSRYLVKPGDKI
jgi:hypothetical protein